VFQTIEIFRADLNVMFSGKEGTLAGSLGSRKKSIVRVTMQVLISLVVIILAPLAILDSSQHESIKTAAWAALASLITYWMR
jgi:hypothetical protein